MAGAEQRRGGTGPVWLAGALAAVLFVAQAVLLADLRPDPLALQMAWGARRFGEIVHQWSPAQLARYRALLPVDGLTLLAYAAFGVLLARRTGVLLPLPGWARRLAQLALPLAAAFDAGENLLHAWLTEVPRFGLVVPYAAATGCSLLKWALILAFGLLLVWALVVDDEDSARPS